MQTGSLAANFRQASRSEYLAQYVFSAFGTSLPVLRQEDHGIDLYCTLTERKGQREWPVAYYSVQVKSNAEPWEFHSRESVEWLLHYPAPLLLCIVDKKSAKVTVYQTTARFHAGLVVEPPAQMSLLPGSEGLGEFAQWGDGGDFELSAPVLGFTVEDILDDGKIEQLRKVLRFWVHNDLDNIRRLQMGLRLLKMPVRYQTNEVPEGGFVRGWLAYPTPDVRAQAEATAWELLDWFGPLMLRDGDHVGTLLVALILLHGDRQAKNLRPSLHWDLRKEFGPRAPAVPVGCNYAFSPFDRILDDLVSMFAPPSDCP
jgi:hypothetical protein